MDYTRCTNRNLWRGEIMMEWTSEKYKNNLMEYEKRDGIKAIIIYCLIMGVNVNIKMSKSSEMKM